MGQKAIKERRRERPYHLKAKAGINHEEDQIGHLGAVDHGAEVIRALHEGEPALLAGDHGNGAVGVREGLAGESLDEGLDESGLADLKDGKRDATRRGKGNQ